MLVVAGQCVRAGRHASQRIQIGVGSDHHIGTHLGRGIARVGREHAQALTEGDRCLMRHPGQLPTAHHCNLRHAPYGVTIAAYLR